MKECNWPLSSIDRIRFICTGRTSHTLRIHRGYFGGSDGWSMKSRFTRGSPIFHDHRQRRTISFYDSKASRESAETEGMPRLFRVLIPDSPYTSDLSRGVDDGVPACRREVCLDVFTVRHSSLSVGPRPRIVRSLRICV